MWGPIVHGPGPFAHRESKGPSRRELWPKPNNIKYRIALRYRRRPLSPRQTHSPTKERGENGIGLSLKGNLKYPGKAALTAIQRSASDKAVFFKLLQPPPNHFKYGLMGQISALESQTYTWALKNGCMLVQKEK